MKKGDFIKYEKEIYFKGSEIVSSKIIVIRNGVALLENGDEIYIDHMKGDN